MADLSALGNLNPVEPLDLENYSEAKESTFRLPPAGRYTLRAPDSFPSAAFTRTKAGALLVQIDPTIVGPDFENFTVRFVKVSAKQFERGGTKVSQLGDYLKACGVKGILKDEQAQADAVESTAGEIYEAKLDWRAYNPKTQFSLEGMTRFPKLADGSYQSYVEDQGDWEVDENESDGVKKDKNGQPMHKRVRANLTIAFNGFIPRV